MGMYHDQSRAKGRVVRRAAGYILCLALAVGASGCSTVTGTPYPPGQVHSQNVQTGTIVNVTTATVSQEPTIWGPVIGGTIGGVAGSMVGGGLGAIGLVGGAGTGALIGSYAERTSRSPALSLTIDMDSGETVSIVQAEDEIYTIGDRVRILQDSEGKARIQLQ